MIRWLNAKLALQWSSKILNTCRSLSLAAYIFSLLSITACASAAPENEVQYFKRNAGIDLTAYGREVGGPFRPADRFNEQADLPSGKIRLALLSAYPLGSPRESIFPKNEADSLQTYEVHYARKGAGKYRSTVRGGATREFEMVVDDPQEKYQRLVENATVVAPWRHQLSFEFGAENTLLDIKVNPSSGK